MRTYSASEVHFDKKILQNRSFGARRLASRKSRSVFGACNLLHTRTCRHQTFPRFVFNRRSASLRFCADSFHGYAPLPRNLEVRRHVRSASPRRWTCDRFCGLRRFSLSLDKTF